MADDQRPLKPPRDMYDVHGLKRPDPEMLTREALAAAESPIEGAFLEALLEPDSAFWQEGEPVLVGAREPYDWPPAGVPRDPATFIVAPQHKIGFYRVDLACAYTLTGKRCVVECDGHDFHERTPEQAERDKSRDVHLLCAGWPVMRFTGRQLKKDPRVCRDQVVKFLVEPPPREPGPFVRGIR